jgi:hypothetical protein
MYKKVFPALNKPITGNEILRWLPDATILKYSELKQYDKLPKLPLILLYEIMPNVGHWVSVLRTPEGIEHFDSYGYAPDDELNDFVPEYFRYETNQDYKYLLHMLYNSGEDINYNQYNLQGNPPIATCGRWTILRNMFNYLPIDKFAKTIYITSKQLKMTPDELVSDIIS